MPQHQKNRQIENSLLKVMWEWGWGARELGSWEPGGEQGSWGAGRWGAGELEAGEVEAGERGNWFEGVALAPPS